MKYLILVFFFLIGLGVKAQNEFSRVTYHKALKRITDNTDSQPSRLKGLEYVLITNQEESLFFLERKLLSELSVPNRRFVGRGGGDGIYYVNKNDSLDLNQIEFGGQKFLLQIESNKYRWKITTDKRKISDFICYKAIAEVKTYSEIRKKEFTQEIIAWFAPEIPVPFGPAGYDDLPGLALEVQIGGVYFIANKIEFNVKHEIPKPKEGKKINEKEFNKVIAKAFNDNFIRN